MKKKLLYIAFALMVFSLCSCSDKISHETGNESVIQEITAILDETLSTKTGILDNGSGGKDVIWKSGNAISLFFNTGDNGGSKFTTSTNGPVASFTGYIAAVSGSLSEVGGTAYFWATYPFNGYASCDGKGITTTLKSKQQAYANDVADNLLVTIGRSVNPSIYFRNTYTLIEFTLTQENISRIIFSGNNSEKVAGEFVASMDANNVVTSTPTDNAVETIEITPGSTTTFSTGTKYYFAFLPGTFSKGYTLTFRKTDGSEATYTRSTAFTFAIGKYYTMYNKDSGLEFTPSQNVVSCNIEFADAAAKYACVAKYDTNGDGEVSIEEAEAATSFDGLFTDWKGVKRFDEIKYFKNVHSLNGVFKGCNKLVSLAVPESITDLGTYAFDGCSSLTSVVLPSGISAIGNYTFRNCSSLGSIVIPANVSSIDQYAFSSCSKLETVTLPSGLTSIADYCFEGCTSLASISIPSGVTTIGEYAFCLCSSLGAIDFPANLTTIGQYAFSSCSKLETVTLPSGLTSIADYCFEGCSSLKSVTIPSGVTSVGKGAFSGVRMWKLDIPSSITSLGSYCFSGIVCIILPSTTPVSIQSDTFSSVGRIFVPSNLIDIYGAMTNWANYAARLHPLDTYKEKNEFTLVTSGAVDMGTSVKWAAYNLGAAKPEEYGGYYVWGETQTKSNYSWSTYKWCNGAENKLTKYCPADNTDYWDGESTPDGKTVLDMEDDAARANWGGTWRMPTDEEWTELTEGCLWEWTTYKEINGCMVYSFDSLRSIFLPAPGYRAGNGIGIGNLGSRGYYLSSSLDTNFPQWARVVGIKDLRVLHGSEGRCYGFSIRPVSE